MAQSESVSSQQERADIRVDGVVCDRSQANIDDVANHGKIGHKKEQDEQKPTAVAPLVGQEVRAKTAAPSRCKIGRGFMRSCRFTLSDVEIGTQIHCRLCFSTFRSASGVVYSTWHVPRPLCRRIRSEESGATSLPWDAHRRAARGLALAGFLAARMGAGANRSWNHSHYSARLHFISVLAQPIRSGSLGARGSSGSVSLGVMEMHTT